MCRFYGEPIAPIHSVFKILKHYTVRARPLYTLNSVFREKNEVLVVFWDFLPLLIVNEFLRFK